MLNLSNNYACLPSSVKGILQERQMKIPTFIDGPHKIYIFWYEISVYDSIRSGIKNNQDSCYINNIAKWKIINEKWRSLEFPFSNIFERFSWVHRVPISVIKPQNNERRSTLYSSKSKYIDLAIKTVVRHNVEVTWNKQVPGASQVSVELLGSGASQRIFRKFIVSSYVTLDPKGKTVISKRTIHKNCWNLHILESTTKIYFLANTKGREPSWKHYSLYDSNKIKSYILPFCILCYFNLSQRFINNFPIQNLRIVPK